MILKITYSILALFFSSQVLANDLVYKPENKSFLKNWIISAPKIQGQNGEKASVQVFERKLTLANHSISMGSLTAMTLPNRMKIDKNEMTESLKTGFDIPVWKMTTRSKITVWEADWEKANRRVRVAMKEENDVVKIITSLYRLGYQEPMAVESYLIENALLRNPTRTVFTPLPLNLNEFFMATANAQSSPNVFSGLGGILDSISPQDLLGTSGGTGSLPTGDILGSTNNLTGIPDLSSGSIFPSSIDIKGDVDVRTQIGFDDRTSGQIDASRIQIDRALDQTKATSDMVDRNWSQSNTEVAQTRDMVDRNWGETNAEIKATREMVDQKWGETNAEIKAGREMVDRNWAETNRQAARANSVAEKLSDPKHMFLLSGATAAGAVVGGFAANMAIQGLITGVDWMIEQMTGKKAAAERWKQFQDARRNWETTQEHALKLERSIDQFLLFQETLATIKSKLPESQRQKISIEDIIRFFNVEILMKQREKRQLESLFNQTADHRCSLDLAERIASMNDLIGNMSQVVNVLDNHKANNADINIFDERYFCNQMDYMMRNLLDAESALQRYRLHLINGQAEWRKDLSENVGSLQGVSDKLQTGGDGILDRDLKTARDLYTTNYDALRDRLKRECRQNGMLFTGGCVSEKLEGPAAREAKNIETQRNQAMEGARVAAERRLNRPVTVNTDIEYDRLRSYQDWFEELEDQQFCNQQPDDEKCRQLAQFRHNGVFYVKNRAMTKLDDVCQDQRSTLSAIEKAQERAIERAPASAVSNEIVATNATVTSAAGAPSKGPGFLSSFFGGIANFFRSIGEFLGFLSPKATPTMGEQSVPEYRETITTETQPDVINTPRVSAVQQTEVVPTKIVERAPAEEAVTLPKTVKEKAFTNVLFEDDGLVELISTDDEYLRTSYPETTSALNKVFEALAEESESQNSSFTEKIDKIIQMTFDKKGARQYLLTRSPELSLNEVESLYDRLSEKQEISLDLSFLSSDERQALSAPGFLINANQIIIDPTLFSEARQSSFEAYRILDELYKESMLKPVSAGRIQLLLLKYSQLK